MALKVDVCSLLGEISAILSIQMRVKRAAKSTPCVHLDKINLTQSHSCRTLNKVVMAGGGAKGVIIFMGHG